METLNLDNYDMSTERGYLCRFDAEDVQLNGELGQIRDVAMQLPQIMPTGRVRSLLKESLPETDLKDALATCTDAQARRLMVHYSFMVQAYVWGEPEAPTNLPPCLAMPMVSVADHLGQQPLLPYSSYVLDNWGRFDKAGPIDLDNIYMLQHFLGGQDEAWFVLVHVAIEAKAGSALALMGPIVDAIANDDLASVQSKLEDMATIWADINTIFDLSLIHISEPTRPY